jgi:hypothetical protein
VTPTSNAAVGQLSRGNTDGAADLPRVFAAEAAALVTVGGASSEQAQPLVDAASRIIGQLQRR